MRAHIDRDLWCSALGDILRRPSWWLRLEVTLRPRLHGVDRPAFDREERVGPAHVGASRWIWSGQGVRRMRGPVLDRKEGVVLAHVGATRHRIRARTLRGVRGPVLDRKEGVVLAHVRTAPQVRRVEDVHAGRNDETDREERVVLAHVGARWLLCLLGLWRDLAVLGRDVGLQ